jgi:hypothetical protein
MPGPRSPIYGETLARRGLPPRFLHGERPFYLYMRFVDKKK